jgi:hypothetical protein
MNRLPLAFGLLLLLPGCIDDTPRLKDTTAAVDVESRPPNFEGRLLDIAGTYESYGRLDTQPRWGPLTSLYIDVTFPPPNPGALARFSDSKDQATHGRKIYWLFVKDVPSDALLSYIPRGRVNPVGQAVVMEAWVPEEVKPGPLQPVTRTIETRVGGRVVPREDRFLPYVYRGNHFFHAKEKAGLFIMYKVDPRTPGTDEGWVYGTVTADGKTVTAAGRIASCMGCHKDAPHDRLFGLAPDTYSRDDDEREPSPPLDPP